MSQVEKHRNGPKGNASCVAERWRRAVSARMSPSADRAAIRTMCAVVTGPQSRANGTMSFTSPKPSPSNPDCHKKTRRIASNATGQNIAPRTCAGHGIAWSLTLQYRAAQVRPAVAKSGISNFRKSTTLAHMNNVPIVQTSHIPGHGPRNAKPLA